MDAYEATKIVFQRIQTLDPQNASKIMGFLLIQDHGEKEMIRLAFGPESLLHSVILKAKKELSLAMNLPSPSSNSSCFSDDLISPSSVSSSFTFNSAAAPPSFYGAEVDLIDELHLSFLNDSHSDHSSFHHRSCSVSDMCDDLSGGWKPCLFYARGYCKNGTTCRFIHGADGDDQQHWTQTQNNFPYSSTVEPTKCFNFQLQSDSPRGSIMSDGMHKFGRGRMDFGVVNPGSRQIYLTFPADSNFKEEDVSSYFSNFGPVQDVRIPYQQKRMFGFVTFEYPETVKLILAKGNPHFVCDARVLVKPYKEKGKIPDKKQQQPIERGEFIGCGSPTGQDSRDHYDLQLGARMLYNNQDILWRRKLEEADLQQAIELQNRRLMTLQLLDIKRNNNNQHHRTLSTGALNLFNQNVISSNRGSTSPEAKTDLVIAENGSNVIQETPLNPMDKDSPKNVKSNGQETLPKDGDLYESLNHNLPDSPFASPKAATAFAANTTVEKGGGIVLSNNNLSLFPASSIDMAPFKSCYFQLPRFASGHETIGM